jgi:hypothetical protein
LPSDGNWGRIERAAGKTGGSLLLFGVSNLPEMTDIRDMMTGGMPELEAGFAAM